MAALSATLPRVSRSVQKQIVTRIPMRRARARGRVRITRRVVVLTAASFAVAGVAAGTAYVIARRFAARPVEARPGQATARAGSPEVALDGTSQVAGAEVAI